MIRLNKLTCIQTWVLPLSSRGKRPPSQQLQQWIITSHLNWVIDPVVSMSAIGRPALSWVLFGTKNIFFRDRFTFYNMDAGDEESMPCVRLSMRSSASRYPLYPYPYPLQVGKSWNHWKTRRNAKNTNGLPMRFLSHKVSHWNGVVQFKSYLRNQKSASRRQTGSGFSLCVAAWKPSAKSPHRQTRFIASWCDFTEFATRILRSVQILPPQPFRVFITDLGYEHSNFLFSQVSLYIVVLEQVVCLFFLFYADLVTYSTATPCRVSAL